MTVLEYLGSQTGYPVPQTTLEAICLKRGIQPNTTFSAETDAIKLAKADMWVWLVQAPNVSQGGISYSFTESEKATFKAWSKAIYTELGQPDTVIGGNYGYQGSRL